VLVSKPEGVEALGLPSPWPRETQERKNEANARVWACGHRGWQNLSPTGCWLRSLEFSPGRKGPPSQEWKTIPGMWRLRLQGF
jgi:hypothetical protein